MAGSMDWSMQPALPCSASIEKTDFATWRRVLRSISTARFSAANTRFRCSRRTAARSSICRRCPAWSGAQSRGLQRLKGRRVAADQIGGAARCAAEAAGALQRGLPGFLEGPMVDEIVNATQQAGNRAAEARISIFRSAVSASRRRSRDLCVYLLSDDVGFHHRRGLADRWRADGAVTLIKRRGYSLA